VIGVAIVLLGAAVPDAYRASIETWRAERAASLTSEDGWLTLIALHPLAAGTTSFGRDVGNSFRLEHAGLPLRAGVFHVNGDQVTFTPQPGTGITLNGKPAPSGAINIDPGGDAPAVFAAGTVQWFVIQRGERLYLRVRDTANPARQAFRGLKYFPIDPSWTIEARFEPYDPPRTDTVLDVLGEEREVTVPGALVFEREGRTWRLDAEGEPGGAAGLFVMFADGTSGRETYGAGRYLTLDPPQDGKVVIDFNRAYDPPCAFNDFATCPLPPPQNRIALRVTAGELKYDRSGAAAGY
jgi:hypothetical protein